MAWFTPLQTTYPQGPPILPGQGGGGRGGFRICRAWFGGSWGPCDDMPPGWKVFFFQVMTW